MMTLHLGPWTVYPGQNLLRRGDEAHRVGGKVMDVLVCLIDAAGEVVSKEQLVGRVWDGRFISDEVLTTVIYELRRALDDDARAPRYVETVRGRGYRLMAPAPRRPAAGSGTWRRGAVLAIAAGAVGTLALGAVWRLRPTPVPPAAIRSLAVQPLDAFTEECREDFFAGALTEMLIADLVDLGTLEVLPRPWSRAYGEGGGAASAAPVADAVVEGSVVTSGDRLWLSVQLVDNRTGRLLWGGSYERRVADALALQRELSLEISRQIDLNVRLAASPDLDPAAP